MFKQKLSIGYSYSSSYLSLRTALFLLFGVLSFGVFGFCSIEGYSLLEAFYMSIITISTVGFQEVRPLSANGQAFTSLLIILNIGVYTYTLAAFSYFIIQGEFFKKMHLTLINNELKQLENHIILCGYGKYGREIAEYFIKYDSSFVIIDYDPETIAEIGKSEEKLLYIEGDATSDDVLLKAGIKKAKSIITALPDDTDNVFTVLSARQLNPKIDIISRAVQAKTERKLELAGADHVIMPDRIGGFYMATLVSKPDAVEFFSFITNEFESDIGFEEINYQDLPISYKGKSIRELEIRKATGANIIGFKQPDGKYIANPSPDTRLIENSSFILLGDKIQLNALREYLQKLASEKQT
ncbi:MAG: potassium channel protein [Bacteroidetes bacterium]|jgi:voltage-gated potassium channel|nr:potassium channel protein [Bacteroidota bacterium]MDF1868691.1 NAD-binding protein [Saprospiraceae bacterium]